MKIDRLSHGFLITQDKVAIVVTDEDLRISKEAEEYRPQRRLFDNAGRWENHANTV